MSARNSSTGRLHPGPGRSLVFIEHNDSAGTCWAAEIQAISEGLVQVHVQMREANAHGSIKTREADFEITRDEAGARQEEAPHFARNQSELGSTDAVPVTDLILRVAQGKVGCE